MAVAEQAERPISKRERPKRRNPDVTVAIVTLTVEMAKAMLDRNTKNRRIRWPTVMEYAGALLRGEWQLNGSTICVDWFGNLLNGQHRLLAIVESGVPMTVILVENLPPETQVTMDDGVNRTMSDTLGWRDEKNCTNLGSTLRVVWNYTKTGKVVTQQHKDRATKLQRLQFLDTHPRIREAMSFPEFKRVTRLLTGSVASSLYYLFMHIDEDDAEDFMYRLGSGDGLQDGDAIYALRRVLEANALKKHSKMDTLQKSALTIKAWNAYRRGEQVWNLRWTPGGAKKEAYPIIEDLDIETLG